MNSRSRGRIVHGIHGDRSAAKTVIVRIIFWCSSLVFLTAGVLATLLYASPRGSLEGGAGMVLIFFTPLSLIAIGFGLVAVLSGLAGRRALRPLERSVGWVVTGLVAVSIAAFSVLAALAK